MHQCSIYNHQVFFFACVFLLRLIFSIGKSVMHDEIHCTRLMVTGRFNIELVLIFDKVPLVEETKRSISKYCFLDNL